MGNPVLIIPHLFGVDDRIAMRTGASFGLGVGFAEPWPGPAQASSSAVASIASGTLGSDSKRLDAAMGVCGQTLRMRTKVPTAWPRPSRSSDASTSSSTTQSSTLPCWRGLDSFRPVIDRNLKARYRSVQACGHVMQPGSSIANNDSILGFTSMGFATSGTRREQGATNRVDARSRPAADGTQTYPRQRPRAGLFRVRPESPTERFCRIGGYTRTLMP